MKEQEYNEYMYRQRQGLDNFTTRRSRKMDKPKTEQPTPQRGDVWKTKNGAAIRILELGDDKAEYLPVPASFTLIERDGEPWPRPRPPKLLARVVERIDWSNNVPLIRGHVGVSATIGRRHPAHTHLRLAGYLLPGQDDCDGILSVRYYRCGGWADRAVFLPGPEEVTP